MKYTHTPEHAARWPEFRDRWIQIAMRTDPMTAEERAQCTQAVVEMYRLAGFSAPRVVFVSSPIQAAMVAGCASWIHHTRKGVEPSKATLDAINDATEDSTWDTTLASASLATRDAISEVTLNPTWDASYEATREAVHDSTWFATFRPTSDVTREATRDATSSTVREASSKVAESVTQASVLDLIEDDTFWATLEALAGASWWTSRDQTENFTAEATSGAFDSESHTPDATSDADQTATRYETQATTFSATWAATWAATSDATDDALRDAAYDAIQTSASYATSKAIRRDAIKDSVVRETLVEAERNTLIDSELDINMMNWDATFLATREAPPEPNLDKWYVTPPIAEICMRIAGKGGLECTSKVDRLRQGGNQWAGWPAMAEWFREVAELPIDWTPWIPWVTLAEHSGPRYLHEKFVVISDFPEVLKVDNENRPHCSEGPFCRWRDGTSLYAWHGIRVPAWIIERPERITIELIDKEDNAEVRRVMLDRYGFARYLKEKKAEVVDVWVDEGGQPVTLYRMPTDDDEGKPMVAVHLLNSTPDPDGTIREYVVRVDPSHIRAQAARNSTYGLGPEDRMTAVS